MLLDDWTGLLECGLKTLKYFAPKAILHRAPTPKIGHNRSIFVSLARVGTAQKSMFFFDLLTQSLDLGPRTRTAQNGGGQVPKLGSSVVFGSF